MSRLSDEEIEKIGEKYPEGITAVHTALGTAVFRCPKRVEVNRFLGAMLGDSPDAKVNAPYVIAVATVVHPEQSVFKEWCEKKGAIPLACSKAIQKLAGAESEEHEKKSES